MATPEQSAAEEDPSVEQCQELSQHINQLYTKGIREFLKFEAILSDDMIQNMTFFGKLKSERYKTHADALRDHGIQDSHLMFIPRPFRQRFLDMDVTSEAGPTVVGALKSFLSSTIDIYEMYKDEAASLEEFKEYIADLSDIGGKTYDFDSHTMARNPQDYYRLRDFATQLAALVEP